MHRRRICETGISVVMMAAVMLVLVSAGGGCGTLRLAPGEEQKQNAYLHYHTVQTAALQAQREEASQVLQELIVQAGQQSEAMLAYYGLPKELPLTDKVEDLVGSESQAITRSAYVSAQQRPDPWQAADYLLEVGVALAGLVGGVYGSKAAGLLQTARQKSQALKEIVTGNERFKQEYPDIAEAFKQSQQLQSPDTRQLVSALK